MVKNRFGTQLEGLLRDEKWKAAQVLLEKQLSKEPEDHWLWSQLSAVKYEQREYEGALQDAEKALDFVPDCPLALWSKANAVEMLGKTSEAIHLYSQLYERGRRQLKHPDDDANECWEGPEWTTGLISDCLFRLAGCLAKNNQRDQAIQMYLDFLKHLYVLNLLNLRTPGIYSREDAQERLKKLTRNKTVRRAAMVKEMEKRELQRVD